MTADIDSLAREALADGGYNDGPIVVAIARHAIRFTLSRYAPHELPDSAEALRERLALEWCTTPYDGQDADFAAFIIRRTREEDARLAK